MFKRRNRQAITSRSQQTNKQTNKKKKNFFRAPIGNCSKISVIVFYRVSPSVIQRVNISICLRRRWGKGNMTKSSGYFGINYNVFNCCWHIGFEGDMFYNTQLIYRFDFLSVLLQMSIWIWKKKKYILVFVTKMGWEKKRGGDVFCVQFVAKKQQGYYIHRWNGVVTTTIVWDTEWDGKVVKERTGCSRWEREKKT